MSDPKKPSLKSLDFLLGDWHVPGEPGEPAGGFRFEPQLQSKVIVRTNHADYPATEEHPAFRHEDLMVIYSDEGILLADYYDSEGHVIRYSGEVSGEERVVFTSAGPGPRFRLSYQLEASGQLAGTFEVASPDDPVQFRTYLSWSAVKTI